MISHNVVYTVNSDDCNRFTAHIQAGHLDDDSRTGADEIKANVRLIAAAPDLLEAIENLLWHTEQLEELIESERGKGRSSEQLYAAGEMHAYMVEAKSCIAKARGEA